jgi:hypothetical protein
MFICRHQEIKTDRLLWVDNTSSPLSKTDIHYWHNRIGTDDLVWIETGGWFVVEYASG